MSLATMLIMSLTATNAKIQVKGLVRKSQDSIRKENASRLSDIVSNAELIKYSNRAVQKASKTAFQLSNYLILNKLFGSVRAQMLQQPSTRIFEYAFKAKFPASQESTSLIYPRAHMYPIIEQEAWAIYKGKNNIHRISFIFLWISGFIAVLNVWPFFKTHPFNQRFIPETLLTRKKSTLYQFDKRIERVWDERFTFSLYKKVKINSTLLNLFSITSIENSIFSNLLNSVSINNILQTNSNVYINNKKELKNYIKVSKKVLNNYKLNNKVKEIQLQFINQFFVNCWGQFLNKDVPICIKRIILFSQKVTQQIVITAKILFNNIGNLVMNIERFIKNKENNITQFLLIRINFLIQFISQTLNKLIRPYNLPIQAILLNWKNQFQQLQKIIDFSFVKDFSNPNQIKKVTFKTYFWKTKVVKNNIKFKEQIEDILHILKHKIFIYLAKISLIFFRIKKDLIFKNRSTKRVIVPFHLDLNNVKGKMDANQLYTIYHRWDYKNKILKSISQIQIKKENKYLFQRYYKVRLAIKKLNQTTYKYLQTVFSILSNQLLQNLQIIALLINQKKDKQIALHIESFFENEKEIHSSIKLYKELSYL
uniref:Transmembrane protein n=1 Tax=Klebsormidium flaccidum TaxID=3175 RepID=A0A024B3G9_KLEFL|nr:hypothetical protein FL50_p002 [Klebsormidium flaccidum]AHZ10962.1 hypothetical protein [Klebsormidium flaccidum]